MKEATWKKTNLSGRALLIVDKKGQFIDDIDTDMIFHNAHLAITELEKMAEHAFGNLDGWQNFPQIANQGDILFVGRNFGAGSSRQQAVDCFRALGLQAIVGISFGAIYRRNAINAGLPLISCPELANFKADKAEVKIDLVAGKISAKELTQPLSCLPFSSVQLDIYQAGSLLNLT